MPSIAPFYYLVSLALPSLSYSDHPIHAQWYSYQLIKLAIWESQCDDFETKPLQLGMYAWDHYPARKECHLGVKQNSKGFLKRYPSESDNT
jgi:hypothetical protein